MMDQSHELFIQSLADHDIELTDRQLEQFDSYYRLLVDWNEKVNLTAITERDQVYIKHFYDSLSVAFFVPLDSMNNLADIGSGAGFPSIPLKILYPHLKLTIIDSLNKRIQFLNHLVEKLELDHVDCLHSRAEDAGRLPHLRDQFDVVTARAVARLNVLNELCLPFVKEKGRFIAMKGHDAEQELIEAKHSMKLLNATLEEQHAFELPIEQSSRQIIVLTKTARTPRKYPRKAGTPSKSPLM